MYIEFLEVGCKNFLSVGNNWLILKLNEYRKNLVIGKNGSGKSTTTIESIIFALYGKPYRNINKTALVNSINNKACEVYITFKINESIYKVQRGIKPDVFKIYKDGILLEQQAATKDYQEYLETFILNMDYKTACQMVIIGSMGYVPFLQLKSADRRLFTESVLDLQFFANMNKDLKVIQADEKSIYSTINSNLSNYKSKIETYNNIIKDLESNNNNKKAQIEIQLKDKLLEYKKLTQLDADLKLQVEGIHIYENIEDLQSKLSITNSKISISNSIISKLQTKIKFFDTTAECQSCNQEINSEHKQKHIDAMCLEINENELSIEANQIIQLELKSEIEFYDKKKQQKQILNQQIKSNANNSEWIKKDIIRLGKEKKDLETSNDATIINEAKHKLQEIKDLHNSDDVLIKESLTKLEVYDTMALALKDTGAKSEIIKEYIPTIVSTVNKYLDMFNLFIKFDLDENFNETLKSRQRDSFSYESFSMGERFRIDASIMFAWRDIARVRAGVDVNVLIMDEVAEICDDEAFDELLNICTLQGNLNVFMISHKKDLEVKFDNVIEFIKLKEFTQIKEN
jgi:energy-coupling factor transporter ATP-binding protein EcfA2